MQMFTVNIDASRQTYADVYAILLQTVYCLSIHTLLHLYFFLDKTAWKNIHGEILLTEKSLPILTEKNIELILCIEIEFLRIEL